MKLYYRKIEPEIWFASTVKETFEVFIKNNLKYIYVLSAYIFKYLTSPKYDFQNNVTLKICKIRKVKIIQRIILRI